jgi:hypothetical protein
MSPDIRRIFLHLTLIISFMFIHDNTGYAQSIFPTPVRLGLSLGAAPVGGLALSADTGPLISENISLGMEVFGIQNVGIRALMWENSKYMAGLYGGAKVLVALGNEVSIEPGAEAGWSYRFKNKIDAGVGINLLIGKAIGGSIKLSCGYLIH